MGAHIRILDSRIKPLQGYSQWLIIGLSFGALLIITRHPKPSIEAFSPLSEWRQYLEGSDRWGCFLERWSQLAGRKSCIRSERCALKRKQRPSGITYPSLWSVAIIDRLNLALRSVPQGERIEKHMDCLFQPSGLFYFHPCPSRLAYFAQGWGSLRHPYVCHGAGPLFYGGYWWASR